MPTGAVLTPVSVVVIFFKKITFMTYHSEKHTAPSPQLMRVVTHPTRDHFVSFTTAAPTGAKALRDGALMLCRATKSLMF